VGVAVLDRGDFRTLALPGGGDVDVIVRRSARARRILLQVGQIDGAVELVLPRGVPLGEALEFAEQKAAWVERRLDLVLSRVLFVDGAKVPFQGAPLRIRRVDGPGAAVRRTGGELLVPGHEDTLPGRVRRWYRDAARREIIGRASDKAERLGRSRGRITVRDQRTRWGSCSHNGNLNFSWRLILAPESVLDYVVAHEVAHLAEMNHGARFWGHVGRLCAEPDAARAWLRARGASLHRFG
jgi:predicted metal-dependent hydrolase